MKNPALILGMVGLSVLSLSAPRSVEAQNTENADIRNTPIRLKAEGATLYSALKTLFAQAKTDFSIAESLKTLPVTVSLNQPFRIALNSVLKAAGQPMTYEFSDGIYRILPAPAEQVESDVEQTIPEEPILPKIFKPYVIVRRPRNLNGVDIASLLGGTIIRWIDGFSGTVGTVPNFMGGFGGGMGMSGGFGIGGFGGMTPSSMGTGIFSPFAQSTFDNSNGQ